MIAGPLPPDQPTPEAVLEVAAGRALRPVWRNELGGLTYQIGERPDRRFIKWSPSNSGIDLGAEAARLSWASKYTSVPRVIDQGTDAAGSWLLTEAVPGTSAVSERWKLDPATAVAAIGSALRALHDRLPVERCPYNWSIEERVAKATKRVHAGETDPHHWHDEHRHLGIQRALELLDDAPPIDRLVVCHGDACAPNTLIDDDGAWSGHVDLGTLGLADRWADLAIATWSTNWNYGPGWETPLLDAYGITPDPERTSYYRLLWDLT